MIYFGLNHILSYFFKEKTFLKKITQLNRKIKILKTILYTRPKWTKLVSTSTGVRIKII
jgi:hypothetical protein